MHQRTKAAMCIDYSPRDERFKQIVKSVQSDLAKLLHLSNEHVLIPLQGGGTYAIEATIGTLLPRNATIGILSNGAYAVRAQNICERLKQKYVVLETNERLPISGEDVERLLRLDRSISHVYFVHCETQSGILNLLQEVAAVSASHGLGLLVDAMSTVGCIEISTQKVAYDALIMTGNKCIEGPPGISFIAVRKERLRDCDGRSPTISLDLFSQWEALEQDGEFRFTPPTHVMAGISEALTLLAEEGGPLARQARYSRISRFVRDEFVELKIEPFLKRHVSSPAVVTFVAPRDSTLYRDFLLSYLHKKGLVLYRSRSPGLTTFQVGCMGQLTSEHVNELVQSTKEFLSIRQMY